MHKELTTLLKLLNGNLEQAPAFLQKVVIQYQWQHAFYGATCLCLAILCVVVIRKLIAHRQEAFKQARKEHPNESCLSLYVDNFDDFEMIMPSVILAIASLVLIILAVIFFGEAISPITSIIDLLVNN